MPKKIFIKFGKFINNLKFSLKNCLKELKVLYYSLIRFLLKNYLDLQAQEISWKN